MLIGPIIIIYVGFEALKESSQVLWALLPICVGLISLYFWIHVKVYFDQLCKARGTSRLGPVSSSARVNPISITVMAPPFPPYDKNYSIYNNAAGVSTSSQKPASEAAPSYELPRKASTEGAEAQKPN